MRSLLVIVMFAGGCGGGSQPAAGADAALDASTSELLCTTGDATKIKFAANTSCANDGSVEFCVPDNDASIPGTLAAISPTIHCAAGGGRAGCARAPGLLLCTYPTTFPATCSSAHGAMTTDAWADMCELSALSQISEIVPTVFE